MTRDDRDTILELSEEYRIRSLELYAASAEGNLSDEDIEMLTDDVAEAYLDLRKFCQGLVSGR